MGDDAYETQTKGGGAGDYPAASSHYRLFRDNCPIYDNAELILATFQKKPLIMSFFSSVFDDCTRNYGDMWKEK